jgi:hypothetical protein
MRMSVGGKSLYAAAVRAVSGMICVLLLAGCATTVAPSSSSPPPPSAPSSSAPPPATTASSPTVAVDAWRARAASPDCRRDLAALGQGALDSFHGLPRCGRVDAEGTLGDSGAAPSQFEKLGEYRVFTSGGRSVLVYFLADDIRVVELLYPTLPRTLQAQLGVPERRIPSELSPSWEQWIYATRGLTAHVQRSNGKVAALFAYAASSTDAFVASDVARVSKSEAPLEELR